ncbi:MAG: hypothetical protein HY761_09945 [Candidatus Omnitrophica bacterium]|nr:hypothetical protein [Candidatus Omnitrophota bacterium]
MTITKEWLKEKLACKEGVDWFVNQQETEGIKIVEKLVQEDRLQWANWLIVRIMTKKQYVSYAVYSAEQVIDIYEKKYPEDKRPRNAIEAAKKCIENPSEENKKAAASAATSAHAAAAAHAAYSASAASAAYSAAASAASAAYSASAASAAYSAAAASAAYSAAAYVARKNILEYGLELLRSVE